MTRFIFRNELKSDIIVIDKRLETTSTANYSKSKHRTKNACMQNRSLLLLYITHLVACQWQWVACQSNKSNLAVTFTANKMDANNKTIDSTSTGSEGYTSIDVSYIIQCIMHQSDPRLLPGKHTHEQMLSLSLHRWWKQVKLAFFVSVLMKWLIYRKVI